MKSVFIAISLTFLLTWGLFTCPATRPADTSSYNTNTNTNTNTNITVTQDAADGLDLKALTAMVKDAANAEDLEKKLNRPGGINNLDLNEDGNVDYIKVTEYGNKDAYGFSLTTEVVKGEVQELATIEIIREGEEARIQVSGNQHVYGHHHTYHSMAPIGTFLLWSYLLTPHPYYVSPWRWGYYPSYYSPWRPVPYSSYRTYTRSYVTNTNVTRTQSSNVRSTGLSSPNKSKVANTGIKKSLANPTSTQKQFQARNPSKAVRSGGFGRSSAGSTSSSSSSRGSVRGSSSSRGFGGSGK